MPRLATTRGTERSKKRQGQCKEEKREGVERRNPGLREDKAKRKGRKGETITN